MKKLIVILFVIFSFLNLTKSQDINPKVIFDCINYYKHTSEQLFIKNCPYFTNDFKTAYKEFIYRNIRDNYESDFHIFGCFSGETNFKVKEIKGNYVLYESEKDSKLSLNTRLVNCKGKTLIDGLGIINMPLINKKLNKELWSQVWVCNEKFEENDAKDMRNVIDDSKNGYLKVSGEYPTCGCMCDATIAAYKDKYGFYTLLRQDEESCDFKHQIVSNRLLYRVLPADFGLQTFIPDLNNLPETDNAVFSIDIDIPRYGTDTKVRVKFLPLGLILKSQKPMVYYYSANNLLDDETLKKINLSLIKGFASKTNNQSIVNNWLIKNISDLSKQEKSVIINELIGNDGYSKFKSLDELQKYINYIKIVYNYYLQMKYESVLMGWDKKNARFYIKEKYESKVKMSFVDFLKKSNYWSIIC